MKSTRPCIWATIRATRLWPWSITVLLLTIPAVLAAQSPKGQGEITFQLATGIGIDKLQARVNQVQHKAIRREPFTPDDKQFLSAFYRAMANGAEQSRVLGQSGRLMNHYLDASGAPLELQAGIFASSSNVQAQMRAIRAKIKSDQARKRLQPTYRSGRFYMPHPSSPDSVFGLYWGTIQATVHQGHGEPRIRWRAEVPWQWPSYESLQSKYGTPHAETFLLPNARSIVMGSRYALHIENGLGARLVDAGLAKPFLAWAEWDESP